jgi:hypothetical protein
MTMRRRSKLSWGSEVKMLLRESGVPRAAVAEALGAYPATLHRYIDGNHRPKPETVTRVNRAVANLVMVTLKPFPMPSEPILDAHNVIEDYLTAIAARDLSKIEAAERGVNLGLNFLSSYLTKASIDQILTTLREDEEVQSSHGLDPAKWPSVRLGLTLLVETKRILLDLARSRPVTKSRFDGIAAVFSKHYPALNDELNVKPEMRPMLIYERFWSRLAASIAKQLEDRDARLTLLAAVESAVKDLVQDLNDQAGQIEVEK